MKDQAGLNGFTQTHFIGKQYPGGMASGDFMGNIDLVRQMLGSRANQPLGGRRPQPIHMLQRGIPKPERAVTIELTGKQALVGRREIHGSGQFDFGDRVDVLAIVRVIHQDTTHLLNGSDNISLTIVGLYFLAHLKHDAGQGGVVDGVGAFFVRRREPQCYPSAGNVRDNAQPQSGIAVADPTLANDEIRCIQETSNPKLLMI